MFPRGNSRPATVNFNESVTFSALGTTLGVVTKCTLTGKVTKINVDGRSYCVVDKGKNKHAEAVEICKKLNARLPLPRNQDEANEFLKISPLFTHVDARNPKQTANQSEWVDAEGKPLGNRPVYLMGQKKLDYLYSNN